ncbi:hypothetical protein Asppvi_005204 [Aspergillus pseudoviridinutans]|uniref:Protein rds1 n=1 Tax=Aspergillus pseudoviridinutans TaxID=1517512 RepID=A0A9P3EU57_9EURO|nr:uncharacterized protein Asppvi_005204 [Aspergillus pseudoviridinutans]GIJ86317.1 hypothetical protein Asppvi_005204 [Aspergillus pseudoviridinutans]
MKSLIWTLAGSAVAVPLASDSGTKVIDIPAVKTQPPRSNQSGAVPPLVNGATTGVTTHGPYSGTPTTTGAEQYPSTVAATIPIQPNPTATYYNANGKLTEPMPMPYMPAGGVGTNGTVPVYMSVALGVHQEYIELGLFHYGLEVFSEQDFLDAGLTVEDRRLIEYMAIQEAGHATLLSNMLGESAPRQCTYNYPFKTVREFIDFNVKVTRWGETQSCIHNNVTGYNCGPAISRDKYEPLTFPGRKVELTWNDPGRAVGPNNSYVTSTTAGQPSFVAWLSQLSLTYTELTATGQNKGYTYQPASEVFETDPALNGTAFIAITDTDMFATPYNLTMLNPHIRALGLYQAGLM